MTANRFYKDRRDQVMALSEALNQEHTRLAAVGCPIIQIKEPGVDYASDIQWEVPVETYVEALNLEVRGLRGKTDVRATHAAETERPLLNSGKARVCVLFFRD